MTADLNEMLTDLDIAIESNSIPKRDAILGLLKQAKGYTITLFGESKESGFVERLVDLIDDMEEVFE